MALARTKDTFRKLRKAYTGTYEECMEIINRYQTFPKKDVVVCRRGNNDIAYYRPCGGVQINDKIWMMHFNPDRTYTLYL